MKKWLKRILTTLAIVFAVLSVVPYLFSLDDASNQPLVTPFEESEFIEIADQSIHYRVFDPENTPKGKLLFVHGLGGSTFSWRENMSFFQEAGYLVVAADLPGFGYSSKEVGTDHSQLNRSQLLWSLLNQVDKTLDASTAKLDWNLAGHSMGGGTVTAMTVERPEDTENLILVDGAVFENQPSFVASFLAYPPLARGVRVVFDRILLNEERIDDFLTSAYGRQAKADEIAGYLAPLQIPGTPNVAVDLVKTAKNIPVVDLKNNQVPILALWGEEDTWVPLAEAAEIQRLIPQTEIITIPGAYHCPMETHAETFNEELLSFLEKSP